MSGAVKLEFSLRHIPWRAPLRAAHGGSDPGTRPLILVRIQDQDGFSGYGEAAPLEGYDGVGVDHVMHVLGHYQVIVSSLPIVDHTAILRACLGAAALPQAIAAVDMALWDLEGRRSGRPIWELLGGRGRPEVEVNATIGAEDPLMAGVEAATAAASGFETVKVKVGVGDDLARVAAVRSAVGDLVNVRVDANGAWNVREAVMALNKLEDCGLQYCEEPVHGIEQLKAVCDRTSAVAVAADESAADPDFYSDRTCNAVCLKIARCGGITGVLREFERSREFGYEVYVASTMDGPLGISAALHALGLFEPDAACGLATLSRLEGPDVIPLEDGYMSAPSGPGLGDGLLEWY
jgi:L-Ala-D/L-Glu epimerase